MRDRPEAVPASRHAILVLGMHRSGTSVLTRFIGALGAALPADPIAATADNPEGHHEPTGLVRLHDMLLRARDSAWFDLRPFDADTLSVADLAEATAGMQAALRASFAEAPVFVVKDPRICRFVALSRNALRGLGARSCAVLALRDPAEIAASLGRRNGMSGAYAGLLWARHLVDAERATRDLPRAIVSYDALLADWRGCAARIVALAPELARNPAADEVCGLLRPELRHHAGLPAADLFGRGLAPLIGDLHAAFLALAHHDDAPRREAVDRAAAQLCAVLEETRDAAEAEFRFQRLTTHHAPSASPNPGADRRRFVAAMQRLHLAASARSIGA